MSVFSFGECIERGLKIKISGWMLKLGRRGIRLIAGTLAHPSSFCWV
jgi:hypothetical protein